MRYFDGFDPLRAFEKIRSSAPNVGRLGLREVVGNFVRPSVEFVVCKNADFVANLAPFLRNFFKENEESLVEDLLEEMLDEEVGLLGGHFE